MAIDKSKWNTSIKVSQKTIDEIKKMGMTKALKTAAGAGAAGRNVGDASAKEWAEGLRRLYTPERVDKLMGKGGSTSGPKSANTPAYGYKKPAGQYTKGAAKSGKAGSTTKSTMKAGDKKVTASGGGKGYSYSTKVTRGKDSVTFGEGVGKAAQVAGTVLLAGRFPGAGRVAAKALPAVVKSPVGRAVFGKKAAAKATSNIAKKAGAVSPATLAKAKAAPKAAAAKVTVGPKGSFGKTTKSMAKKGVGTPSEYASRAAQFGGPTNITIKKAAKKAATKKAGKK